MKLVRGNYGYYKYKRIQVLLRTIILFVLALSLYFFGRYHLDTVQSVYTVIAVLGLLPASKSAVSTIMHFRAKECKQEVYEQVAAIQSSFPVLYSLYITMYQHSTTLDCIHIYENHVIIYGSNGVDQKEVEGYLAKVFAMHTLQNVSVKVMTDREQYCNRVIQLNEKYDAIPVERSLQIETLIKQLAL
ncbi:MAG: hypothetical protein R3Y67_07355 [Eubacteriales bacterium]